MTVFKRSVILLVMLCLFGPALGWSQMGPVGKETIADNPTDAVSPAPSEASSPSERLDWLRENVTLSAGLKIWVAHWQAPLFTSVNTIGQGLTNISQTNATAPMLGPTVTLSTNLRDSEWLNSAFVNFTWLQAGGFEFDPIQQAPAVGPNPLLGTTWCDTT